MGGWSIPQPRGKGGLGYRLSEPPQEEAFVESFMVAPPIGPLGVAPERALSARKRIGRRLAHPP